MTRSTAGVSHCSGEAFVARIGTFSAVPRPKPKKAAAPVRGRSAKPSARRVAKPARRQADAASTSTPEAATAVEGEEGRGRRYLHSLRPSSPLLAAEAEGQAASTKNPSSHRHQVRVLINTDLKIRKFVYITGTGYFRFTFYFFCGNFVGFMFFPAPRDCKIETKKVS